MKKLRIVVAMLLLVLVLSSCTAHVYQMGSGPQNGQTIQARQWYILWGLIPLNDPAIDQMIGECENYQIRTAQEPVDVVMNIFTSYITVNSRTITVTK